MKKGFALAIVLALPMMAYSLPAVSASHEKAGDTAAEKSHGVSDDAKAAATKACEKAENMDACMAKHMADHKMHESHESHESHEGEGHMSHEGHEDHESHGGKEASE